MHLADQTGHVCARCGEPLTLPGAPPFRLRMRVTFAEVGQMGSVHTTLRPPTCQQPDGGAA